jgi:hypothetical protein
VNEGAIDTIGKGETNEGAESNVDELVHFNDNHFEKLCSNDKVIQSIKQLIDANKEESANNKK